MEGVVEWLLKTKPSSSPSPRHRAAQLSAGAANVPTSSFSSSSANPKMAAVRSQQSLTCCRKLILVLLYNIEAKEDSTMAMEVEEDSATQQSGEMGQGAARGS